MAREMSEEAWAPIDEALFAHRIIEAIKLTRAAAECSLREANEMVGDRYAVLRARAPDRFVVGPDEYWANFYS